jgi:hypothetical protein
MLSAAQKEQNETNKSHLAAEAPRTWAALEAAILNDYAQCRQSRANEVHTGLALLGDVGAKPDFLGGKLRSTNAGRSQAKTTATVNLIGVVALLSGECHTEQAEQGEESNGNTTHHGWRWLEARDKRKKRNKTLR